MNYETFFCALTGKVAHGFQVELAQKLLAGRSVVLRAPTGTGKTWATVAPFLYSLWRGQPQADRLLYTLPLRSLASSLHHDVFTHLQRARGLFGKVASEGKDREYQGGHRYCSLQMGGEGHDPFFESDLVFTTIDQLLSGYLGLPVSLPRRLGNMVGGALVGSYIVFDELHLLEPSRAMGTTIEMLDRLHGLTQFVLMTATLSDSGVEWLGSRLRAEPFVIPDSQIRRIPSHETKRREWRRVNHPLTAKDVQQSHCGGRTIALTNTVSRAQSLFKELRTHYAGTPTKVILLHSRFFPCDRKVVEDQLAGYFGPDATLFDVVLVTTQAVEAGIDISADELLTDLAPMNALIQRAGRVARYPHRNRGRIAVFDVENPRPYNDAVAIQTTRDVLLGLPPEGRVVDFMEEQLWIDRVHGGAEEQVLKTYENLHTRRQQVHEAMEGDQGKLPDLVRDIDSVSIILTECPEDLDFSGRAPDGRRIGWPRMLSSPRTSLMRLRSFFDSLSEREWIAKGACEAESDGEKEGPGLRFKWQRVESAGALRAQWLVAVHPDFGSYDPIVGLVLGERGSAPDVVYGEQPQAPRYQYDFELWADHARRVRDQGRIMHQSHRRAAEKLARSAVLTSATPEQIELMVELACALHDTGKLATAWQAVAWRWQRDKDGRLRSTGLEPPERPEAPLAHTSFDPVADRQHRGLPQYQFPNHALEGAYAVEESLCQVLTDLCGPRAGLIAALAIVSAIARHHAPRAKRLGEFRTDSAAMRVLSDLLGDEVSYVLKNPGSQVEANSFGDRLLNLRIEEHELCWPLFAFLIRRLRLADQASFK